MPPVPQDVSQLDPKVVKVMSALKKVESGGDYNAVGDGGQSHGAYQWNKDNFANQATQFGLDPHDMSPANQNKVAYARIKALKDEGKQPEEIAAIWNGAKKDPMTGQYTYINPEYGKLFRAALGVTNQGHGYQTTPALPSTPTQEQQQPSQQPSDTFQGAKDFLPGVASDISSRIKQGSQAVGTLVQGAQQGDLEKTLSGSLQTAGAVAGAAGDVMTRGVETIPGVKNVEDAFGSVLGKVADTSFGRSVIGVASDWAKQHPEAAANIGAAANIASVFPMFKAAGMAAATGRTAIDKAMISSLTKAAGNEIENGLGTSLAAKNLVKKGTIDTVLSKGYFPEVTQDATGKYVYATAKADAKANAEESALEDKLQGMLTSKSDKPIALKQARDTAIKDARDTMRYDPNLPRVEAQIHDTFDNWESRFGDKQTLSTLTDMKRDVRQSVKFDQPSHEKDAAYYVGQGLMKSVEDTASSRGIKGVDDINAEMGKIINARKMLAKLEGKSPKVTKVGRWGKEVSADVLGGVGEALGGATGLPFAGTLAGRGLAGLVKSETGKSLTRLARAKGPLPSLKQLTQKGLMGALLHNKQGIQDQGQ